MRAISFKLLVLSTLTASSLSFAASEEDALQTQKAFAALHERTVSANKSNQPVTSKAIAAINKESTNKSSKSADATNKLSIKKDNVSDDLKKISKEAKANELKIKPQVSSDKQDKLDKVGSAKTALKDKRVDTPNNLDAKKEGKLATKAADVKDKKIDKSDKPSILSKDTSNTKKVTTSVSKTDLTDKVLENKDKLNKKIEQNDKKENKLAQNIKEDKKAVEKLVDQKKEATVKLSKASVVTNTNVQSITPATKKTVSNVDKGLLTNTINTKNVVKNAENVLEVKPIEKNIQKKSVTPSLLPTKAAVTAVTTAPINTLNQSSEDAEATKRYFEMMNKKNTTVVIQPKVQPILIPQVKQTLPPAVINKAPEAKKNPEVIAPTETTKNSKKIAESTFSDLPTSYEEIATVDLLQEVCPTLLNKNTLGKFRAGYNRLLAETLSGVSEPALALQALHDDPEYMQTLEQTRKDSQRYTVNENRELCLDIIFYPEPEKKTPKVKH